MGIGVKLGLAACLLLFALLPFAHVRAFPHVHDDHDFRGVGSLVTDGEVGLPLLWRADVFGTPAQPHGQSGYWRPLLLLSFRLEHMLTGGDSAAFAQLGHVVTIVLHAGATLALWWLLTALGLTAGAAFVAATLFAVHPIHAEPVAWLSGRTDVIPILAAWTATALMVARDDIGSRWVACALLLAALLCKESAVMPVVMAPLLVRLVGRSWRTALLAPLAALAAYGVLRTVFFEGGVAADAYLGPQAASERWLTWLSILPDLFRLTWWAGPPATIRPVAVATSMAAPGVAAGCAALLLACGGAAWAWWQRRPVPLLTFALWAGTMLLLAPWVRVPLGYAEVAAPLYERHLYGAAAAPAVLVALLLGRWIGSPGRALVVGLVGAALLAPQLRERTRVWSSDEAFARAALEQVPASPTFLNHLGWSLMLEATEQERVVDEDRAQAALTAFESALVRSPDHFHASLNRFILLAVWPREGEASAAEADLLERHGDQAAALHNAALWHVRSGRLKRAVELMTRELATGAAFPGTEQALQALQESIRLGTPAGG